MSMRRKPSANWRFTFDALPIDYVSVTAHKIHGPQGVGALYVRAGGDRYGRCCRVGHRNPVDGLEPRTCPESQGSVEPRNFVTTRFDGNAAHVAELRDGFEQSVRVGLSGIVINGGSARRAPGSTNIFFAAVDGQALVAHLDRQGVYCSQSSACTNLRPEPSYVLRAMGLSEEEAYSGRAIQFLRAEHTRRRRGRCKDRHRDGQETARI